MGITPEDAEMANAGESEALSDKSQALSVSSFTSVSVLSESTTVYTNVGCALASLSHALSVAYARRGTTWVGRTRRACA